MGTNYYLRKKDNYVPGQYTSTYHAGNHEVLEIKNGFVWNDYYYPTIDELNKVYYRDIHIGKASYGWHFLLCIYPTIAEENPINTLDDWKVLFDKYPIIEEDETQITKEEMLSIIENRGKECTAEEIKKKEETDLKAYNNFENKLSALSSIPPRHCETYEDYLRLNSACRGKNGLLRHKKRENIIYTDGTYDYYVRNSNEDDFF